MSKLFMLAGGIVEPGGGRPGRVSAFIAYNPRPGVSRLFRVQGATDNPRVSELPSATTVDLGQFRRELEADLASTAIAQPKAEWVADIVRRHLKNTEGLDVG